MKKLFILLALAFVLSANAQDDKTVTLTVTGQGKTIDEAKTNALRSAIEQAFGAFISSNTTILNDNIIKDEIVAVTNGNIQKFDIINETTLPDGTYAETLKATVSVSKLTTYCESKGVKAEFQGGLFAMNIAIQDLNEKNERIAWKNLYSIIDKFMSKCFDYTIEVSEPKVNKHNPSLYEIPLNLRIRFNDNYTKLLDMIFEFSKSISLNPPDLITLGNTGKKYWHIEFNKSNSMPFYYRNQMVYDSIKELFVFMFIKSVDGFVINNGVDTFSIENYLWKEQHSNVEVSSTSNCLDNYYFQGENDMKRDLFGNDANTSNPLTWGIHSGHYTFTIDKFGNKVPLYLNMDDNFYSKGRKGDLAFPNYYFERNGFYANFYGHKNFIELNIVDYRTIEDIKKIKEYKVELKN